MGEPLRGEARSGRRPDDEERRRLQSLGYLGGAGGGTITAELPDPRRMTDVAMDHDIAVEFQSGSCEPVLTACAPCCGGIPQRRRSRLRHPLPAANRSRGEALRFAEAAARRIPCRPRRASIAPARSPARRKADAKEEYRRALAIDPASREAALGLARLLRGEGLTSEAREVLDRAIAAGARDPGSYLERGITRAELRARRPRPRRLQGGGTPRPAQPLPLGNAARAAQQRLRRFEEAADLYRKLIALEPGNAQALTALGVIHGFEWGQPEAALRYLRQALASERDGARRQEIERLIRRLAE
jgi:tetratricopeptide (TPR) repeat protein